MPGLLVAFGLFSFSFIEARRGDAGEVKSVEALSSVRSAPAATITVNSLADGAPANNGQCTLREAIINANSNNQSGSTDCTAGMAGADTIVFNVGTGTPTINVTSALPTITEPVTIQGNTGGATRVELNGAGAGASVNGLTISAGNSVIERLVINRFTGDGIQITGAGFNTVKGCILGLDSSGTIVRANNVGVAIRGSSDNIIGSIAFADRNTISGNTTDGVLIASVSVPNPPNPPTVIAASRNKVINSYIGSDITGRFDVGNTSFGVNITGGDSSIIGGATEDERNIISGNNGGGVRLGTTSATNNRVIGNYIGTDFTGVYPLGNGVSGGGGLAPGVLLNDAVNNSIGGTADGEFNFIKYNLQNGGIVLSGSNTVGNSILRNYISENVGKGIDKGSVPAVPNAPASPGVSVGSTTTTFSGSYLAGANQTYRFEFFLNNQCDSSGSGEGETYLGTTTATTNIITGIANYSLTLNDFVAPAGTFVTATATLVVAGTPRATSEFSGCSTVPGSGPSNCTPAFLPPSANFRHPGGTTSISVKLAGGCSWTASSNLPWVTIQSGASGTGNGTVVINVSPNTGSQRIGQITIAGQNYGVTQEGPCTASLDPAVRNYTAAGGPGVVELITGAGCAWSITNSNPWITINSATSGTGPTFVEFTVAAYTGTSLRIGTVLIGGQAFTVLQDQPCGATISPDTQIAAPGGGNYSSNITIPPGCNWTATTTETWINLGTTGGTGSGVLNYSVAANNGIQRAGIITVAGKTLAISQASSCQPTFSPENLTVGSGAGSHSFNVNIGPGCNWTPTTSISWITITSGSGTGNGTVNFTVTSNPGIQRIGTITVAGLNYTIIQDGACSYSLSETVKQFQVQGGTATVNVTAPNGCSWMSSTNTPWIVITSGSGTGNGTVNYVVATNGSGSLRTGTMNVAGVNYIVQQDGGCTYTVSPLTQAAPAGGGAFTTSVTTSSGCPWTASSNVSWITITSSLAPNPDERSSIGRNPAIKNGTAGTGNGTVGYSVAANTGPPRTGTIFAAGELITINQASGCPITVSPANLTAGTLGANYSQTLSQTGGSGSITWSVSSGSAPPGLMLNPTSGLLSGIPTVPGTFMFTARATDSTGCYGEMPYALVINCQPLNITTASVANGIAGSSYSQTIALSGGSGQTDWTISAGALPSGLSLHPTSGVISGAPQVTGAFNFTVKATVNSTGCFTTRSYSMSVGCQTITINETLLGQATVGVNYNQTLTQSNGIGSINWSITAGSLPSPLTLSLGGVISGIPVAAGSFPVTFRATDANGCFGEKSFTLTIGCTPFNITPASLPAANYNVGYSQQLSQTGASGAVTWSLASGSLPTNLTLSPGGLISGTPNVPGSFPITVRATEQTTGCFTDKAYTLTVNCPVISVTPTTLNAGTFGVNYSQQLSQTGGVGGITWSVSAGSLPANVTLNSSGLLSGPPSVVGTFNFTAKATDANGCFGERAYQLVIGCQSLGITPTSLSPIQIATPFSQQLTLTGGSGTTNWTISAGALPSGITLNPASGLLSGQANVSGTFNFTARATLQTTGCFAEQAYSLVVNCPTINITPTTLNAGYMGVQYSQQLSQTGGVGGIIWTLSSGTLPNNINLSAGGLLAGTPVMSGSYSFTVRGTDGNGCFGERSYTLVINTCPVITIMPNALPNGAIGANYNQTLTASGGAGGYSFSVSGTLPTGMTLSPSGLLSGIPGQVGPFNIIVTVTDQNGCTGSQAYTLFICSTITVNPALLPSGIVGTNYSQNLNAVGGSFPHTFNFTGTLPNGLTLDNAGLLSGIPIQPGTFNFAVTATDTNSCTGTRNYTVIISGTGLMFYPLPRPIRLLDTRAGQTGCDAPGAPIAGGTSRLQTAAGRTCDGITIPATARALTGNITTVQSGGGFLTLYPSDATQPTVANSNYLPNQILNNVFTVGLGAGDGAFKIFVTSNTDVVVDVTGYYAPPGAGGLYFHPLPNPIRMLETRAGQPGCDTPGAPIAAGVERIQQGRVFCGGVTIPANAAAIVGNATVVAPAGAGFLTLYPGNAPNRPLASTSNYEAGQVMNGPFTVGLATDGTFKIYSLATTELVIDVLGYYSPDAVDLNGAGLLFNPLPRPVRLMDSRSGATGCYTPGAPLAAGSTQTQQARGVCDGMTIAATAQAVVGNATVVNPSGGGYLTFWPSSATQPLVANSNYLAGQVFNRHFTVGLGADGAFKIFTLATTELVIDVSGYFAP